MEVIFLATGHSFMPNDGVVGILERAINKKDTIVELKDYYYAFAAQGTVKSLEPTGNTGEQRQKNVSRKQKIFISKYHASEHLF